ncbi:hypothetical protein BT63DRAFT_454075 [Microthyrium microscopicum]|uniref:F-box domain-containing protein n=1 Tax=Microthyrium microscopicum TaxID=703497 RepID=A0A6A6UEN7_9PEZI|nr:hypothetical protein BT63DRAFT_454075 [Microthyrium microscopicum]
MFYALSHSVTIEFLHHVKIILPLQPLQPQQHQHPHFVALTALGNLIHVVWNVGVLTHHRRRYFDYHRQGSSYFPSQLELPIVIFTITIMDTLERIQELILADNLQARDENEVESDVKDTPSINHASNSNLEAQDSTDNAEIVETSTVDSTAEEDLTDDSEATDDEGNPIRIKRVPKPFPLSLPGGPFPFMKLPGEIRNLVYEELFVTDKLCFCCTHFLDSNYKHGKLKYAIQFLRVSKKIHEEASSVLYGRNTMFFDNELHYNCMVIHRYNKLIKKVRTPDFLNARTQDVAWPSLQLLLLLPNVRHFEVKFPHFGGTWEKKWVKSKLRPTWNAIIYMLQKAPRSRQDFPQKFVDQLATASRYGHLLFTFEADRMGGTKVTLSYYGLEDLTILCPHIKWAEQHYDRYPQDKLGARASYRTPKEFSSDDRKKYRESQEQDY